MATDALCMTAVRVFDADAHTIYITKIVWVEKLYVKCHSV
jgi:hypothetical protein